MAEPSFYNANLNRAYPLLETSVGMPVAFPYITRQLPNSLIVDCGFIMGIESRFDASQHKVWINHIELDDGDVLLLVASDAPGLAGKYLQFRCPISGDDYQTVFAELIDLPAGMTVVPTPESLYSDSDDCSVPPLMSGFIVFGRMQDWDAYLGLVDSVMGSSNDAVIEPALIQSMVKSYIASINIANQDRSRSTAPLDCPDLEWPYPVGADRLFIAARCLTGDVFLQEGFNNIIRQDTYENSITLQASKGAGQGEPCEELKLFYSEVPPAGSTLLDGSVKCNEIIRTINGTGGQVAFLTSGTGVQIATDPELHKILVDVNMVQLFICFESAYSIVSETL